MPLHDVRGVLRYTAFRRLFIALAVSSLGDWLGLLATTALASSLAHTSSGQVVAIGGVLVVRLLPAVVLGPFAGAVADRFDRRFTMVTADVIRGALFVTIPLVGRLDWLYASSFLIEAVSLFWIPAKEASVPNLLPARRLEAANTLSLIATYGSGAVAAGVFSLLSVCSRALAAGIGFFRTNPVDLSLYFDAATFALSAATVATLREITGHRRSAAATATGAGSAGATAGRLDAAVTGAPAATGGPAALAAAAGPPPAAAGPDAVPVEQLGVFRSILEGWRFIGQTPLVRGLVVGILGAFAAGGCVIALGRPYVALLHGGNAAYGLLFGGAFTGLAIGMAVGPRLLAEVSRRRLFGMAIVGAGSSLALLSVLPNLVLALLTVVLITSFAGVGWVTGYTLLGLEVADEVRGRTFAFVQSMVRTDLLVVLAVAPLLAGAITKTTNNARIRLPNGAAIRADGTTVVLLLGGLTATVVGMVAFRQMDDRPGLAIRTEIWAALRHTPVYPPLRHPGLLIAFEGGEGTGKSTQLAALAGALRRDGHDVVTTREPGATAVGRALRAVLLDPASRLTPRAEALLYAADRAQHVDEVLLPALRRGAVVLTDRFLASSLAYQGAGRTLPDVEVRRLQRLATGGLTPDLTVLLDLDVATGLARAAGRGAPDRIEAERREFHERVRQGFLALAQADADRWLVLDAAAGAGELTAQVHQAVLALLAAPPGRRSGRAAPAAAAPTAVPAAADTAAGPADSPSTDRPAGVPSGSAA